MKPASAKFIKGIVGDDPLLRDGLPQIAFVGRSNVGKSTLINTLTQSSVARTSRSAGSTQEMNAYLVNKDRYFLDLPGYGFARASGRGREKITELIDFYLFQSPYVQKKVVLVVDAVVGMTDKDISMFEDLKEHGKDIVIIFNKIDKLNQSENQKNLNTIRKIITDTLLIPFSSRKKSGLDKLTELLLS